MKNYLKSFFERYEYPEDSVKLLLDAYDILENNAEFGEFLDRFYKEEDLGIDVITPAMKKIAADTGLHMYTVPFLYYICLSKELPKLYEAKGIDISVMWDSLWDFKYKLLECLDVHGVHGFFACGWFYDFLRAKLFKLGRLEYHIVNYNGVPVTVGGKELKAGDKFINMHIPSAKESFSAEVRYASYERAYHFFKQLTGEDIDIFGCGSWLLFGKNREILDARSNIVSFMDDFKLTKSALYENPRDDMWRIFGKYADAPAEELPRDTSLRRAYADYLMTGGAGHGSGFFRWDKEKKQPTA